MKPNKRRRFALPALVLFFALAGCQAESAPGASGHPNEADPTAFPNPTSSDGKILNDLASGLITKDQAWVYRIQARFNPAAMPSKYLPTPQATPTPLNPPLVNAALEALPSLSLDAQLTLIPYLLPPSSPESFWNQPPNRLAQPLRAHGIPRGKIQFLSKTLGRVALAQAAGCPGYGPIPEPFPDGEWKYVDDSFFRFWYRTSDPNFSPGEPGLLKIMNRLRQTLYIAKNRYESVTGKSIIDDSGQHAFVAKDGSAHVWCDGGNGKLDIYLTPISGVSGLTIAYPGSCSKAPSFMVIDAVSAHHSDREAQFSVAHELMHVFQLVHERRLACEEYADTDEGMANWAAHHVLPENNYEHDFDLFSRTPYHSFFDAGYNGWPFFLGVIQSQGISFIPRLLAAEMTLNPFRAMDQVLNGGFRKSFPEYTVLEWNQLPTPSFKDWDGYTAVPQDQSRPQWKVGQEMKLDGRGEYFFEKQYSIPKGLTRAYEKFTIDPKARTLHLSWNNGGVEEEEDFHLRVMIKRAGQWTLENRDPTPSRKRPYKQEFCFDEPGVDRIEEIVLAFSRTDIEPSFGMWDEGAKIRLRAGANNIPCYAVEGTATILRKSVQGTPGTGNYHFRNYSASYSAGFQAKRDEDGFLTSNWEFVHGSGNFSFEAIDETIESCAQGHSDNPLCRIGVDFMEWLTPGRKIETCTGSAFGALSVSSESSQLEMRPQTTDASFSLGKYLPFFSFRGPA